MSSPALVAASVDVRFIPGLIDPVTLTVKARSDRPRADGLGVQTL
jgi:hypothetical protein